ncbi:MAG: Ppx/GppA family phosphatase [Alphaproteobacteria bacterium]|nr:Ppx/GppA family phosphatase [Alphaproteobacteria bacterium]
MWGTDLDPLAQGRLKDADPVAVLDIGSNSIRLVVYERHGRVLTPLYNEKSAAGLGRGIATTGKLSDQAVERGIRAIRRFALVVRLMQVSRFYVLATSATREASNGAAFTAQVEAVTGVAVRVLTGMQEAHFSALGVLAGINAFSGIVGDLGGGSLELARLEPNGETEGETHALGAIRIQDDSGLSLDQAGPIVRERIGRSSIVKHAAGRTFAAIGGTWRSFAKLHQIRSHYPLHMVQHYTIAAADAIELCDLIISAAKNRRALTGMREISANRRELLPYGSVVLGELLRQGEFSEVVFSALGVREGYLFSLMTEDERHADPLLVGAAEMAQLRARSPLHGAELVGFSDTFFAATGIAETPTENRLRIAACHLSDIGWRGHPDYRGEQSVDLIAFGSMTGIDHKERAFLAEVLAVRYMGLKHKSGSAPVMKLAGEVASRRARLLGAVFRLAYPLSAGMPGVLGRLGFDTVDDRLVLDVPREWEFIAGERVRARLKNLADEAGFTGCGISTDP